MSTLSRRILRSLVLLVPVVSSSRVSGQTQAPPNCDTIASPPPLATFGGPATAARGETELGLAVGGYGALYPLPCGHEGGSDWLVRWRRGVSDRIDLGFDFQIANQGGGAVGGTAKLAMRYQVNGGFRLEGGVGASDTGFAGHSTNADLAAVIGTTNPEKNWNYYTSLRLAGSVGCNHFLCVSGSGSGHPPDALLPLGAIGAAGRVADNVHFILEAGLGGIFSRQRPDPGLYIHLSFGALFDVRRNHN